MRVMRLSRKRPSAALPDVVVDEPAWTERPELANGPERELASRDSAGLHIVLLWDPRDGAVAISVADARNGREIRFPVAGARALDAFHHPFAYAR